MKLYPHVNFGGQCADAFRFYEQSLGGKIVTLLTWGDSPMAAQIPSDWHDKICHASLTIGDAELAGVDDPSACNEPPKGFQIILDIDWALDADRIFSALASGGTVKMPLGKTFWAERYGIVVDKFGVGWEINCSNPA